MKRAQVQHRRVQVGAGGEFLVVDRQDEGAGAALLLGELRQVAIAGDAQHLEPLGLDGLRERADAQSRGVLGPVVFVDDDDGETEFHGAVQAGAGRRAAKCMQSACPPARIAHNAGLEHEESAHGGFDGVVAAGRRGRGGRTGDGHVLPADGWRSASPRRPCRRMPASVCLALQLPPSSAAAVGVGAVGAWYLARRRHPRAEPRRSNRDVNLDIGEHRAHRPLERRRHGAGALPRRAVDRDRRVRATRPPSGTSTVWREVVGSRLVVEKI
jgi:hypothetical protein